MKKLKIYMICILFFIYGNIFGVSNKSIKSDKAKYQDFIETLKEIINEYEIINEDNHFFVSKRTKNESFYLYWKEKDLIINFYDTYLDSSNGLKNGLYAGWCKSINGKDVVADGEFNPSTYMLFKSEAQEIIYECVVNGDLIVVPTVKTKNDIYVILYFMSSTIKFASIFIL